MVDLANSSTLHPVSAVLGTRQRIRMNLFIQKSMNANLKTAIFGIQAVTKYANDSFAQSVFFKCGMSFHLYLRVPPSRSFIIPPGGYPDEMDQRPLQGPYLFGKITLPPFKTKVKSQKSKSLSFTDCNEKKQKSGNRSYTTFTVHGAVTRN